MEIIEKRFESIDDKYLQYWESFMDVINQIRESIISSNEEAKNREKFNDLLKGNKKLLDSIKETIKRSI